MNFTGISKARAKLAELARGLRAAASGAVVARAAEKVGERVRRVAQSKLSAHELTGAALSSTVVDVSGGLVQLHGMPPCNGKGWSGTSYVGTKSWWPFRGGVMPPFILAQAAKIFQAELVAAIGGHPSPLALADAAAEEAAAAKKAKAEERARKAEERHQRAVAHERAQRERGLRRAEREGRAEARRGRRPE